MFVENKYNMYVINSIKWSHVKFRLVFPKSPRKNSSFYYTMAAQNRRPKTKLVYLIFLFQKCMWTFYQDWQWSEEFGRGEIFADMFVGWVYGQWEADEAGYGTRRANYMNDNMPYWIAEVINNK